MADKPETDKNPGIEVTPEMIEAGLDALFRGDDRFRDDESLVRSIYRAMEEARSREGLVDRVG